MTLKWGEEVFGNMLGTCFQILLIRMSIFFSVIQTLHFKKIYNILLTVFKNLKCTIPHVPSRSLLFQALLIFNQVVCCLLISGPACSCCSSPCRWNMQVSPSHSLEYSWNDDWQSRRTTGKETEMLELKTRNNQNRVSLHFPKTILWPLSALSFEWNMHQFQLSVLIYLPLSLQLECVYEHSIALLCQQDLQPTYKRNLEARMSSCQSSTASLQQHFVLRSFGERVFSAPLCLEGECQKHCSTLLCEAGGAKFYPKRFPLHS